MQLPLVCTRASVDASVIAHAPEGRRACAVATMQRIRILLHYKERHRDIEEAPFVFLHDCYNRVRL